MAEFASEMSDTLKRGIHSRLLFYLGRFEKVPEFLRRPKILKILRCTLDLKASSTKFVEHLYDELKNHATEKFYCEKYESEVAKISQQTGEGVFENPTKVIGLFALGLCHILIPNVDQCCHCESFLNLNANGTKCKVYDSWNTNSQMGNFVITGDFFFALDFENKWTNNTSVPETFSCQPLNSTKILRLLRCLYLFYGIS